MTVHRWMTETDPWPTRHSVKKEVVLASDYDEAVRLLLEAHDYIAMDTEEVPDFWNEIHALLCTADSASPCRHDWVTDGIGPTACCKCGVTSTVSEVTK
jgi:hypothetical protein